MKALPVLQLDDIRVASPCHAEWGDMVGSDTVRFCASCQKNVYNLSGMERDQAIELLRATEGNVCVRFYRRKDGTVLTEDCPVGIRLAVQRAKKVTLAAAAVSAAAVAAVVAFLGGSFFAKKIVPEEEPVMGKMVAEVPVVDVPVAPTEVPTEVPVMGQAIAPNIAPDIRIKEPLREPIPEMGKPAPPPPRPKRAPKPHKPPPAQPDEKPSTQPQVDDAPEKTMGLVVLPKKTDGAK